MEVDVPKIEDEYLMGTLDERPVLDRYYIKRYYCDPKGGDYTLLIHSNKICVIMLAPSHPIIKENLKISSINFQSANTNRLDNRVTGKKKQGAQLLTDVSIMCKIHCENQTSPFTVRSGMVAKLMEVNERLQENPELLKSPTEGFIAIIFPKRGEFEREVGRWITVDEYEKVLAARENV